MSAAAGAADRSAATFFAGPWPLIALAVSALAYQVADPVSAVPLLAIVLCVVGRALQAMASPWHAPDWLIGLAVLVVVAYAAFVTLGQGFEVRVFAHFMLMLGAIKCFERRTPRDDGQLLLVSTFVILSTAVTSSEMVPGVLTLVYLLAVSIAAMRIQIDAVGAESPPTRSWVNGLGLGGFVAICLIGLVLFFVLPRELFESREGLSTAQTQRSVTQFRESVELGTAGLISQDRTEVMQARVWLQEGAGRIPLAGTVIRLRGQTLDRYRDGRWERSDILPKQRDEHTVHAGSSGAIVGIYRPKGNTRIMISEVTQFSGASGNGTVFTRLEPFRFELLAGQGTLVQNLRDNALRLEDWTDPRLVYSVRSQIRHGPTMRFGPRGRIRGEIDPAYAEIAARVLLDAGIEPDPALRPQEEDQRAASALSTWLTSTKSYTLDIQPATRGADPTLWFINEAEAGHCEYFASSLAMLLRAVGIPSRVVTGYLLAEYDSDAELYRIRRSHAHAWVEAEIGFGDWREFDATPPASLSEQMADRVNPFTRWLSTIETAWLSVFVSFDGNDQEAFRERFSGLFGEAAEQIAIPGIGGSGRIRLGGALLLGALTLAGFALYWHIRRSHTPRTAWPTLDHEARRAAAALERFWSRRSTPRLPGRTLAQHAEAVGPESAVELAEAIETAAFAPEPISESARPRIRSGLAALRAGRPDNT